MALPRNKISQSEAEHQFLINGFTLTSEYVRSDVKSEAKCNTCTYVWSVRPSAIFSGKRCPICNNQSENSHRLSSANKPTKKVKLSLELLTSRLAERGLYVKRGQEYVNSATPLTFVCINLTCRHEFTARPSQLLFAGTGCPKCTNNKPLWKAPKKVKPTNNQSTLSMSDISEEFIGVTKSRKLITKTFEGSTAINRLQVLRCSHPKCYHEWSLPITLVNTSQQRPTCPKCSKLIHDTLHPEKPLTARQITNAQAMTEDALTPRTPKAKLKTMAQLFMYELNTLDSAYHMKGLINTTNESIRPMDYLVIGIGEYSNKPILSVESKLNLHQIPNRFLIDESVKLTSNDAEALYNRIGEYVSSRGMMCYSEHDLKLSAPKKSSKKPSGFLQTQTLIVKLTSLPSIKSIITKFLAE